MFCSINNSAQLDNLYPIGQQFFEIFTFYICRYLFFVYTYLRSSFYLSCSHENMINFITTFLPCSILVCMVANLCHHLSDYYNDLSYIYVTFLN